MAIKRPSMGDPNEPQRSFADAQLKVGWANIQFGHFIGKVDEIIQARQESAVTGADAQGWAVGATHHPIPPWVALATGDMLFSLRSALDCCWMGLKRAINANEEKGTLPRSGNGREQFVSSLSDSRIKQVMDTFAGSKELLTNDIRPYKGGNDILWMVGKVDNWNKHNLLIASAQQTFVARRSGTALDAAGNAVFTNLTIENCKFEGIGSFEAISSDRPLTFYDDPKPDIAVDIILISREPVDERPLVPFLRAAIQETDKAVKAFSTRYGQ